MTSIGFYFGQLLIRGESPSFTVWPSYVYVLYQELYATGFGDGRVVSPWAYAHCPSLCDVPALAWPLHIVLG